MAIKEIKKNKYQIVVVLGYDENKRIRHIETFTGSKKEATIRENELKIQLKNNTYVKKTRLTFGELMNEWLESSKNQLSPKTYYVYQTYSKNIIKCLGHIVLANLNSKLLEGFYKDLQTNTTFSDRTIQHHYTIISTALNRAVKWDYISNNPNMKIDKPKVKKKEIQCYNPEQVNALVKAISNESLKYQALIMLALDSSCRRGELTGLNWSDVDFKNSCISITKSTQYVSGKGSFEKSTKTETSNRNIIITSTTLNILKKYQLEQMKERMLLGKTWGGSERIFTTNYGADMHPDTPSRIFDIIIKKYNLPRITFHGLRHTSISLQIASGVQAQIISKRAGHSNVAVTHGTYSHFFEQGYQDVADKMNVFLESK